MKREEGWSASQIVNGTATAARGQNVPIQARARTQERMKGAWGCTPGYARQTRARQGGPAIGCVNAGEKRWEMEVRTKKLFAASMRRDQWPLQVGPIHICRRCRPRRYWSKFGDPFYVIIYRDFYPDLPILGNRSLLNCLPPLPARHSFSFRFSVMALSVRFPVVSVHRALETRFLVHALTRRVPQHPVYVRCDGCIMDLDDLSIAHRSGRDSVRFL